VSDSWDPSVELPPALGRRIDEVCNRFEAAWRAAGSDGAPPRIEDYLTGAAGSDRQALLRELLLLDLHYRRRRGERPGRAYYAPQFSDDGALIRAVLTAAGPAAQESSRLTARPGPTAPTMLPSGGAPLAEQPAQTAGKEMSSPTLPGYEILGELGRGGMGVVYRARQTTLKRIVALKMILSGDRAAPEELARFRREAVAVARLRHPNIVQVYAIGEYNGRPFFSLEFVDGGTLSARIRAGFPSPKEAAALVELLARAMHEVHQCNVVHRDLKPANVLLTADGTPKITDFGLAKKLDDASGQTHTGAIMGTPSYMAPEQASGATAQATPLADVYALGAILNECLTGRPPFKAATVTQTLQQVIEDDPVAPRTLNSAVPRDLETICLKCLRKDPTQRYATANDLAEDLRRLLALEPILARPVGRAERAAKWMRRHRALTAALLVFAVGAIFSSALAVWATRRETELQESKQRLEESENKRQENEGQLGETRIKLEESENKRQGNEGQLGETRIKLSEWETEANRKTVQKWLEPQGLQARSDVPLHDREVEALWELASTKQDPLRLLFAKEALREPATIQQLSNRRAFALHAAVGLDQRRRREVERLLVDRLSAPETPSEQKVHLAMLVAALGDAAPDSVHLAAAPLTQALGKETNDRTVQAFDDLNLQALAEDLAALAPRLDRASAKEAVVGLTSALGKARLPYQRPPLLGARKVVLARLDPLEAAAALIQAIDKEWDSDMTKALVEDLAALAPHLDAASAKEVVTALIQSERMKGSSWPEGALGALKAMATRLDAARAKELVTSLSQALGKAGGSGTQQALAEALKAVAARLHAAEAREVAAALTQALGKPTDDLNLRALAEALGAVAARLDTAEATAACRQAAAVLTQALAKGQPPVGSGVPPRPPRPLEALAEGLAALAPHLDAATAKEAVAALTQALGKMPPNTEPWLGALSAVAARLEAAEATAACRRIAVLIQAIGKERTAFETVKALELKALSGVVAVLVPYLDAASAKEVVTALTQALGKEGPKLDTRRALAGALKAAVAQLDAAGAKEATAALTPIICKYTFTLSRELVEGPLKTMAARLDAAGAKEAAVILIQAIGKETDSSAWGVLSGALMLLAPHLDAATAKAAIVAFTQAFDKTMLNPEKDVFGPLNAVAAQLDAAGAREVTAVFTQVFHKRM
jgi:serine/threonine protein kinase